MDVFTQSPALDNALVSPSNWASEQWVHDQFAWLRQNEPLKYLARGLQTVWNARYDDIKQIEARSSFSLMTLGLLWVSR